LFFLGGVGEEGSLLDGLEDGLLGELEDELGDELRLLLCFFFLVLTGCG